MLTEGEGWTVVGGVQFGIFTFVAGYSLLLWIFTILSLLPFAISRFLKHGAKGKWKEGEVVNLGEGLRVMAKKPHVTKEDVTVAQSVAEETRRRLEDDVAKLRDQEKDVDERLAKRNGVIDARKK